MNDALEEQNELHEYGKNQARAIRFLGEERVDVLNEQGETEEDIAKTKAKQLEYEKQMGRLARNYLNEVK